MKKNKPKTVLIFIGVFCLTALFLGAYVYSFYAVKEKSENASLVFDELNEYLSKGGTINTLKMSIKNTKEDRKKVDAYFVKRDDIPDFTRKIESLGGMSGTDLTITALRSQGDVLSFDLSSEGSFKNTLQLISLIESLPFKVDITKAYIDVVEVEIPKEDGGGIKSTWKGNYSIDLIGFISK